MKKMLIAATAATALALSGCATTEQEPAAEVEQEEVVEAPMEEAPMEDEPVDEGPGDIVAVAVEAGSFTTLAAALEAAGLVETLQGEGPFTVFAPTDEAFAALPEGVLDALLLPENIGVLEQILLYHVVSGEVMAADVVSGDVTTVEGSTIAVEVGDQVTLNGTATVITTDVDASNRVIHVIDQVILPPGVDPAALLN